MDDTDQLRLLLLGGTAASLGTNWLMHSKLKRILNETPNLHKKDLPKVYESAGIPKDFPTFPVKGLENAYYASPLTSKLSLSDETQKQLSPEIREKIKQMGHIAYDPKFNKAGIIAHEAGHAAIRTNNPWYHPSRMNQSVLRTISDFASPLSGTIGTAVGLGTENALYGALAGLGSAGVLGAPTLINEAQATGYAKDYLSNSKHKGHTKTKNRQALNRAYGTYLMGALSGPTLAGGLAGSWGQFHQK